MEVIRHLQPGHRRGDRQGGAAGPKDVDKAVKAARRALETGPWATMDAADRGRLMFRLADLVEAKSRELAILEIVQLRQDHSRLPGRHGRGGSTLSAITPAGPTRIEGRTVPVRGNFLSYTLRQPVGVVGQIIPWNFPC